MNNIGSMGSFLRFGRYSHNWDKGMNDNLIKAGIAFHLSVKSRVGALPGSPSEGDVYLLTTTGAVNAFLNGEWYVMSARIGIQCYVEDEEAIYIFIQGSSAQEWKLLYEVNADYAPIERNLSFYQPGLVRPGATMFFFIPTMEFKLPAGAPNSYAKLEKAPVGGNLVLTITALGGTGTITFADGQVDGVFSVASDIVILPADFETLFSQPQELRITSSSEAYDAEGLSVSLKGEIRSIDEG